MTAADHVNAAREPQSILREYLSGFPKDAPCHAALDVLEAQAKAADRFGTQTKLALGDRDKYRQRAEAAEAERDELRESEKEWQRRGDRAIAAEAEVERVDGVVERLQAQRDWLDDEAERQGLLAAEWNVQHDEMRAERDRLREALRRTAFSYHKAQSHPRDFDICTWPLCRRARAALAGETA